jgi:hypothetical protein
MGAGPSDENEVGGSPRFHMPDFEYNGAWTETAINFDSSPYDCYPWVVFLEVRQIVFLWRVQTFSRIWTSSDDSDPFYQVLLKVEGYSGLNLIRRKYRMAN